MSSVDIFDLLVADELTSGDRVLIGQNGVTKTALIEQIAALQLPGTVRVVNKTVSYDVTADDSLTTFTTLDAPGTVNFNLPVPIVGMLYQFVVGAAFPVNVNTGGGATIAIGELLSSPGGSVTADGAAGGLYATLTILAISTSLWIATTSIGPWTPS